MKKPITRKEYIFRLFGNNMNKTFSCQEITNKIIKWQKLEGSVAHYLSGSVTTILAALVKKGTLKYDDKKTPRGGHLYRVNMDNVIIKDRYK